MDPTIPIAALALLLALLAALLAWRLATLGRTLAAITKSLQALAEGDSGVAATFPANRNAEIQALERAVEAVRQQMLRRDNTLRIVAMAEEVAHIGHWKLDTETQAMRWSAELYRIHGQPPGTFLPTQDSFLDLYHPQDRESMELTFADAVQYGHSFALEGCVVRPDGSLRTVEIRGKPDENNDNGKSAVLLGTLQDITERKQAAEKLQEYTKTLEQQKGELAIARDKAEESTRLKSEFLANMSHEIRTPMNGILGMVSLLLETPLNEKQRHYAATAMRSTEALLELIGDILDLSKIEAGKLTLEHIPFDLKAVCEEVNALMTVRAGEKGVEMKFFYPQNAPSRVVGDPTRIRQLLINLCGNAVKFTEEGYIAFTIELLTQQEERLRFRIAVEDTGIGIPEDKQAIIFNKFDQADSSTSRKFGGTGLGLAICREMCHRMDGEIGVESTLGKGSKFWCTLMLEEDQRATGTSDVPSIITGSIGFTNKRILLAEDNPVNQLVACSLLEKFSLDITTAENGKEAVSCFSQEEYDLLFMDCQMPEMDGFEATRIMRELEKQQGRQRTPIIALTANAMKGDEERCLQAGMDGYLTKPVTLEKLESALHKWLTQGTYAA